MRRIVLFVLLLLLPALAVAAPPARVLVYGDSNSWGWVPVASGYPTTRYPAQQRWPGVMGEQLCDVEVLVDALSGRTAGRVHPFDLGVMPAASFNGLRDIETAVARELPLDLVIIMLGSNDVAADQQLGVTAIAEDVAVLVRRVRGIDGGVATSYPPPAVLLVAPPALGVMTHTPIGARFDEESRRKSRELAVALHTVAQREGAAYFDAASVVPMFDGIDGIHLSAAQHRILGEALAAYLDDARLLGAKKAVGCAMNAAVQNAGLSDVEAGLQRIETLFGTEPRQQMQAALSDVPLTAQAGIEAVGRVFTEQPSVLPLKTRELITVAVLAARGDAAPQLRLHLRGALAAGASREEIFAVLDQIYPYVGFPVALNAIAVARELFAQFQQQEGVTP